MLQGVPTARVVWRQSKQAAIIGDRAFRVSFFGISEAADSIGRFELGIEVDRFARINDRAIIVPDFREGQAATVDRQPPAWD